MFKVDRTICNKKDRENKSILLHVIETFRNELSLTSPW